MARDHKFLIGGKRWLWRYTRLRGEAVGWTFVNDVKNQSVKERVLIDTRLRKRAKLDTEIHEYLHASNPTAGEEHVTQQATDLARILWSLGYRQGEA